MLAAFAVKYALLIPRSAGDKLVLERLNSMAAGRREVAAKSDTNSTLSQLLGPARVLIEQRPITNLVALLVNSKKSLKHEKQLLAANLDELITLADFYGIKMLLAFILAMAGFVITQGSGILNIFALVVMGFIGYQAPNFFLSGTVDERQNQIKRFLPDAIDLLIIGMEAGLGFDRALRLYCERFKGPLSDEFRKMLSEIDVGQTRREALTSLASRNQLEDLNLLVSSILQAEKLGTPLSAVLTIQSATARTRHRQWVQELSAKAPIKMLFPLAGLILPALFAVLMGPILLKMMSG